MSFEIKAKKRVITFIAKISAKQKKKIEELLLLLKDEPVPVKSADVAKLKGFDNIYRIRIGKIRIVYEVKWKEKIILIHRISYRKDAYK